MTCVRVASWRVWDHTSRTDKAWVLVWSALKVKHWSASVVYETKLQLCAAQLLNCDFSRVLNLLIVRGYLSRARYPTALLCLWSLCCLLSTVWLWLCDCVVDSWCALALVQGEIAFRDVWCIWAMRCRYPVAFSSRKKGSFDRDHIIVLCVSQYLYVPASSVV